MGSHGTFVNLKFKFMKVALTPLEEEQNSKIIQLPVPVSLVGLVPHSRPGTIYAYQVYVKGAKNELSHTRQSRSI